MPLFFILCSTSEVKNNIHMNLHKVYNIINKFDNNGYLNATDNKYA